MYPSAPARTASVLSVTVLFTRISGARENTPPTDDVAVLPEIVICETRRLGSGWLPKCRHRPPPMSAESTVSRNYLDWLLAVPWKKKSKEIWDIDFAEHTLNEDHFGSENIQERILDFLAVRLLVKHPQVQILCLV